MLMRWLDIGNEHLQRLGGKAQMTLFPHRSEVSEIPLRGFMFSENLKDLWTIVLLSAGKEKIYSINHLSL